MTFSLKIMPSAKIVKSRKGRTVLESALSEGISLAHSCKDGRCGACKATLLEGKVSHCLDAIYDDVESNEILTCCVEPASNLLIQASYYPELESINIKILPAKVADLYSLNNDVLEVRFRLPPKSDFRYLSGQYIDLMWNGKKRSYSISNRFVEGGNQIAIQVKRIENGVFSNLLFNDVKVDQLFRISGPHGTFFKRATTNPIIFMCTGTGFAPVKAMVESLIESKTKERILIYWGGRKESDLYSDLPSEWASRYENIEFKKVLSRATCAVGDFYNGYVQEAVLKDIDNLQRYEVYACGSEAMIESAKKMLVSNGLTLQNFHSDAFLQSR